MCAWLPQTLCLSLLIFVYLPVIIRSIHCNKVGSHLHVLNGKIKEKQSEARRGFESQRHKVQIGLEINILHAAVLSQLLLRSVLFVSAADLSIEPRDSHRLTENIRGMTMTLLYS